MKKDKRKDKKEATKRKLIFIALAAVLVLTGCTNPVAEDGVTEHVEGGTIVIRLGNLPESDSVGAARSATGMALVQHTILLHREEDGSLYRTVGPHAHGSQVTITAVTPGSYTMTVNSTLGGAIYASGTASSIVVTEHAGASVSVNMTVDFAGFLAAAPGGASAADPVVLPLAMPFNPTNWENTILPALAAAGQYVALDLSAMPMPGGTVFDPNNTISTGKDRIVSLILPDAALSIADGILINPTFQHFINLETVVGRRVTSIGNGAFAGATSLTSVSFPLVTSIGGHAFVGAANLTSVSFPLATSIGDSAFTFAFNLTSVYFPLVTSIGDSAFWQATSLTSVSFPLATSIGNSAFRFAVNLTNVYFPLVTSIDASAFANTTSLTSVSFPLVTSIGDLALADTSSLTSVTFPLVTDIGNTAFLNATSLASITIAANVDINPITGGGRFGDFRTFYEAQARAGGTYTFIGGVWTGPVP